MVYLNRTTQWVRFLNAIINTYKTMFAVHRDPIKRKVTFIDLTDIVSFTVFTYVEHIKKQENDALPHI